MGAVTVIGTGQMGSALARGICKGKGLVPSELTVYDVNTIMAARLADELGCHVSERVEGAVSGSRYIFLCVKPHQILPLISELGPIWSAEQTIISIAAGLKRAAICTALCQAGGQHPAVVRMMPNTPAAVGQGVLLVEPDETMDEAEFSDLETLVAPCGLVERVTEQELDIATALTGCGPAFAYLFLEGLADGAVELGLSREKARLYAAKMLAGAAAMAMESGKHTGQLKDEVCSPGGSTIAGVAALERAAFRAAAAGAVTAAYEKNRTLG